MESQGWIVCQEKEDCRVDHCQFLGTRIITRGMIRNGIEWESKYGRPGRCRAQAVWWIEESEENGNAYDLRRRAGPRFLTVVSMASQLWELVVSRAKMVVETQVLDGNLAVAVEEMMMMTMMR